MPDKELAMPHLRKRSRTLKTKLIGRLNRSRSGAIIERERSGKSILKTRVYMFTAEALP